MIGPRNARQRKVASLLLAAVGLSTLSAGDRFGPSPLSGRAPAVVLASGVKPERLVRRIPTRLIRSRSGPSYSVNVPLMDAAKSCTPLGQRHAVLLVHGTATTAHITWPFYTAALIANGYAVCTVDLPHIGTDDIQVSSEYVARAIQTMSAESRGRVTVITHSQGGLEARWAMKYFPTTRGRVDVIVELGAPNHGTSWFGYLCHQNVSCVPAVAQMVPSSNFISALNEGSPVPGGARYVNIYSRSDTAITPVAPPTAALNGATNLAMDDVCPGRVISHGTLLNDPAVLDVVLTEMRSRVPVRAPVIASCDAPMSQASNETLTAAEHARSMPDGAEPPLAPYA